MSCAEWISLVDVVITAFLTAVIICQTKKLNESQQTFEKKQNQQQIELQKRQIQADTFSYKREIYKSVFSVLEFSHFFNNLCQTVDLTQKSSKEIGEMLQLILNQYAPDKMNILWNMREAEYVLSPSIATVVIQIRKLFDNIVSRLSVLSTVEEILISQGLSEEFQEIKTSNIQASLSDCKTIEEYAIFIENVIPKELNISELHK